MVHENPTIPRRKTRADRLVTHGPRFEPQDTMQFEGLSTVTFSTRRHNHCYDFSNTDITLLSGFDESPDICRVRRRLLAEELRTRQSQKDSPHTHFSNYLISDIIKSSSKYLIGSRKRNLGRSNGKDALHRCHEPARRD